MLNKHIKLVLVAVGLVIPLQAEEVSLFFLSKEKKETPIFYQEPSNKSGKVPLSLQANEALILLKKQKGWLKVGILNNSGDTAWITEEQTKTLSSLKMNVKKSPKSAQYQLSMTGPDGRCWHTERFFSNIQFNDKELDEYFKKSRELMEKLTSNMAPMIENMEASIKTLHAKAVQQSSTDHANAEPLAPIDKTVQNAFSKSGAHDNKTN